MQDVCLTSRSSVIYRIIGINIISDIVKVMSKGFGKEHYRK